MGVEETDDLLALDTDDKIRRCLAVPVLLLFCLAPESSRSFTRSNVVVDATK